MKVDHVMCNCWNRSEYCLSFSGYLQNGMDCNVRVFSVRVHSSDLVAMFNKEPCEC